MKCRRCGKELPAWQKKTCPFCGIYLNTIITPRDPSPKARRPKNRALLLSFISVSLILIVVTVIVPLLRGMHKADAIASMEEAFAELHGNKENFTDDEWEMRLVVFSIAVNNFENSFPSDTANIEKFRFYLRTLLGIDPENPEIPIEGNPQEIFDRHLITRAKTEIIDIRELTVSDTGLGFIISNPSERILLQVRIWFEAFDSAGNSLGDRAVRTDRIRPILPYSDERMFFSLSDLWGGASISRAKIIGLEVEYGPNESYYFRSVVCEALWP
jgi:hypothetical protein